MKRGEFLDINSLTAVTILSDDVMCEIMDEKDPVDREKLIQELTDKARELKVKPKFEKILGAFKKKEKEFLSEQKKTPERKPQASLENYTSFDDTYDSMFCGNWIADDNGIRTFTMFGERLACYHPIIPVTRLVNHETGREKVKLAFKKGFTWKEIIVEKGVIASASRIVSLADYGVSVTSETAKALVSYLSDIENYNILQINTQVSTSKLGWIDKEFMPYEDSVIFDSENRFKSTYDSICPSGDEDAWYDLVKKIRRSDRVEPKIYIAGALASALLEPMNALPFIINLWGDTGKGKTVAIMLAASVWAYPAGNDYVADAKSTPTALELRLDFLNNLPMLIDDLAQMKEKYQGDFSELVYMLCSGKGKDRANVSLGLNKSTTWKNVILTNGEHSLVTETMQGGAVNRIIDVEMEDGYIFENGNYIVETIKKNYGWLGKEFVELLQNNGFDEAKELQQDFLHQINERAKSLGVEKEEKQSLPMSILLAADKLATDYIFHDGIYLDFDYCVDILKDKGEVSENERAYEFIVSEIAININKFKPDMMGEYKGEVWGEINARQVIIMNNAFKRICDKGNFSSKSFLSWAKKQGLIECDSDGKTSKNKKINGGQSRCVFLKLPQDTTDFVEVNEDDQKDLPFNK